jgi:23S rRNA pseudouridine2604 synthase
LLLGSDEQVKESASEKVERLLEGVHSEGDFLEAADIRIQNADQLNFVLKGGKYHHIRRMCEIVGWHVHALKRVRIGSIRLQDLPVGKWRYLEAQECKNLQ